MVWSPDKISPTNGKEKERRYFFVEAKIPYAVDESQEISVDKVFVAKNKEDAEEKMYLSLKTDQASMKGSIRKEKIMAKEITEGKYREAIARAKESSESFDT